MNLAQRLNLSQAPVFLMDGTAFIYRSFYANRHLRRSDGFPTNALTLVTRVLLRILKNERPEYFLFAMDGHGHNLRKDIYPAYKANREAMPEDLSLQIEPVKKMVRALGLRLEVMSGHEADDCLSSLASRFKSGHPVIIISGDKDLKQCLGPNVFMWDPGAKEEKLLTEREFTEEEGVTPGQWADVQAIIGDSSDNIPGVPGIGPKTARQIFAQCGNLEAIRDHLELLPPKLKTKLEPHLEEMFTWRKLTTLRQDACPTLQLADLAVKAPDLAECRTLTREFELNAVYREIALYAAPPEQPDPPAPAPKPAAVEPGLPMAPEYSSPSELPDATGHAIALVWPGGLRRPPRVAVDSPQEHAAIHEFTWLGPMAEICGWLGNARQIIVPAWKDLLAASPSWRKLRQDRPSCPILDLALASWLLDPEEEKFAWPHLADRWGPELGSAETGPATLALMLARKLETRLDENGLTPLYKNLELPLAPVLAQMQERGIAIDPAAFTAFLKDVQARADSLTEEIFKLAGEKFNLRSAQKLGEILFGKLGLAETGRTRTGLPSTSQTALEKLDGKHPIINYILEFRKLDKMRSTYLDPLPRYMDAHNRIHSTFNQEATATGRISSSDPNLQNIPVKGELGKRMRACFVASPGHLLVAADYSQIELRILAHFSQDANLLEAFQAGEDIHARTASLIFDVDRRDLTPDQRRMAKTINFGLLYGMGARKLAQELHITPAQAKSFIDRYFERLTGLKTFYAEVVANAQKNGFVSTMSGRRRWLPGINSANGQMAAQAQRQAVNTIIQGSAADIMKLAMINTAQDQALRDLDARLVLQVHDELLLETPKDNTEATGKRVAEIMRMATPGGISLKAPLLVDWGAGENWGEAH